jgi:predicted dehydrogenase
MEVEEVMQGKERCKETHGSEGCTRRDFIKFALATTVAGMTVPFVHAQGKERLRVGLIGCGGRGTGAALDAAAADPAVEIYALGDLFKDRVDGCLNHLKERLKDRCNVTPDRCFTGFDNYKGVIGTDVDIVILATPPGFRPVHFRAAVEAGKHVFMEKPVAVCPAGARVMLQYAQISEQKKLTVVAGTQRRHDFGYRETINRIREGAIGEIVAGYCYWNQGGLWAVEKRPEWTDVEWQIRNWLYFTWLSGDHIVEQHIHNIDIINWVMGSPPAKAMGVGGRQARTAPIYGHIYDHFAIEFEYPNGVRVLSMCRQIDGCPGRVTEYVVGTKGVSYPSGWLKTYDGQEWRYTGQRPNPYVQEWVHLIQSVRGTGPYVNETRQVTESTLTAIMGRMAAYTGQEVTWDFVLNKSQENYLERVENLKEFGPMPVDPVAIPGKTKLI